MKRLLSACAVLAALSAPAMAEVVKYDEAWGENCYPSKDSYAIKLQNETTEVVDIKVCLERTDGLWNCYVSNNIVPGQITPYSWGYNVCYGTGRSKWWWRDAGDYSTQFPDP